jgi:polyisoprenoid-binding protein YceI
MSQNWKLDPAHSELSFKVKHLMISNVTGKITKFDVQLNSDDDAFTNPSIQLEADMASIDTGMGQRDEHLKSQEFFDVANHPTMKFVSKSYANGKLNGDLTIRNVTRPVVLDAEFGGIMKDPWGNTKAGFTISGTINRKEWDLTWNAPLEAGGLVVSEDVKIMSELEFAKA